MEDVKITVGKLEVAMPDKPTDEEAERFLQAASEKVADDMWSVLFDSGAFQEPRPTALRLTASGGFEVVELHDDGSIIEPPKRCPKCSIVLCTEHIGS